VGGKNKKKKGIGNETDCWPSGTGNPTQKAEGGGMDTDCLKKRGPKTWRLGKTARAKKKKGIE